MLKSLKQGGGRWHFEDIKGTYWMIERITLNDLRTKKGRSKGTTLWFAESEYGDCLRAKLKKDLVEQINTYGSSKN